MSDISVSPDSLPALDLDSACEFLELTYGEIMTLVPQALVEIRNKFELAGRALDTGDLPSAMRHAHTIKSVAASIGAKSTCLAAEAFEIRAKAQAADNCPQLLQSLGQETTRLAQAINSLFSE